MASTNMPSKDFFDLIKGIGEAKSKQEEDRIISHEVQRLKLKMGVPDVSKKQMREYVIRLIHCELLGHDSSFGYIHAVNMCHSEEIMNKRVGYLACCLCLNSEHELMILLVNTLQRDLKSTNHLKICAALTACCRLINTETMPAVLTIVVGLMSHSKEIVRKKALITLHRFIQIDHSQMKALDSQLRRILCDKDPSVMGASLNIFLLMAQDDDVRPTLMDLVPSFASILKQITEHRLPRDYDYHRVPAPWHQITLLNILALLGQDDKTASEQMYNVLEQTIKAADNGISIGYAIIYECVRTISRIYPNPQLTEAAASAISVLIESDSHNLKYLGITGLAEIVKVSPRYALRHQMIVIDCLEDPDDSLKRKTLDLLFRMTTPQNMQVICDKLLSYLQHTVDAYLREELVTRVTLLAERFAPDNEWFISTMNHIFELGGKLVKKDAAHNLIRLIAEGTEGDEDANNALRVYAVNSYLELLDTPNLPDILLQVIAWVVGEYAYLTVDAENYTADDVENQLCQLIELKHINLETKAWGITALSKFAAQFGGLSESALLLVNKFKNSTNTDLQQRCFELDLLVHNSDTMATTLPIDSSCEDIEVDANLSFLDSFIHQAERNGAPKYLTKAEREDLDLDVDVEDTKLHIDSPTLKMDSYPKPESRPTVQIGPTSQPIASTVATHPTETAATVSIGQLSSNAGVKRRWGRGGYSDPNVTNQPPSVTPEPESPVAEEPITTTTPLGPPETLSSDEELEDEPMEPAKQLSEKERLAASLFGGINEEHDQTKPAKKTVTKRTPKASRTRKPIDDPKAKKQPDDLLNEPKQTVPTASTGKPSTLHQDLLDLGNAFGAPSPQSTPQRIPKVQPSKSSAERLADDLLGGLGLDTKPIQPTTTTNPTLMPANLSALYSNVPITPTKSSGAAKSLSPQQAAGADPLKLTLPPSLAQVVAGAKRAPRDSNQMLATDMNVHVGQYKAFCDDDLVVALFITSQCDSVLSNITLAYSVPDGISASVDSDPLPAHASKGTASWRELPAHTSIALLLRLSCAPQGLGSGVSLTLSYYDQSRSQRSLRVTVPLILSDMLRPAINITSDQFSATWSLHPVEKRGKLLNCSIGGTAEYMAQVGDKCNIRAIQAIGTEVIAAGQIAGSQPPNICLIHATVVGAAPDVGKRTVELTVHTKDRGYSEAVLHFMQRILG